MQRISTYIFFLLALAGASIACSPKNELEIPPLNGELGLPLHTYRELKGFALQDAEHGKHLDILLVFEIDGKELKKHIILSDLRGLKVPLKEGTYILGGYETGSFVGVPEDVVSKSSSWKRKLSETETFYDPFQKKKVTQSINRKPEFGFDVYFNVTDIIMVGDEPGEVVNASAAAGKSENHLHD